MTYLKTDNCLKLDGTGPGHNDGGNAPPQVRYKYSPAHQDAAVCCTPNAGRIFPAYLRSSWLKSPSGLTLALYGPGVLKTEWNGKKVTITQTTDYPKDLKVRLIWDSAEPIQCTLTLRKPAWASEVRLSAPGADICLSSDRITLTKAWSRGAEVSLEFVAEVRERQDRQGNWFVEYGPQVYCLEQQATETRGRVYAEPDFQDRLYHPVGPGLDSCWLVRGSARCHEGKLTADFRSHGQGETFRRELVPMAWTLLRQVTFPARAGGPE